VRFYFTATEFLNDYNANLSKAFAAKKLPLTILWRSSKCREHWSKVKKP